jgi:uncharacterized membrane protein YozB (DUF420 family)
VKAENLSGLIVGVLFVVSAFVPLGSYHFEGEAKIIGILWNFMLPTGWFGILVGVLLILRNKIGLKNKRSAYVMFTAGLLSIVLFIVQDVDYFLCLWNGVNGDFDVDGKWFLTPVSLYL